MFVTSIQLFSILFHIDYVPINVVIWSNKICTYCIWYYLDLSVQEIEFNPTIIIFNRRIEIVEIMTDMFDISKQILPLKFQLGNWKNFLIQIYLGFYNKLDIYFLKYGIYNAINHKMIWILQDKVYPMDSALKASCSIKWALF